jgi:predicted nucleotidyltransferase
LEDCDPYPCPQFGDVGASLPAARFGSVAWGDYDDDSDLDILITGLSDPDSVEGISRVYRNEGGHFVDAHVGLDGVEYSSAAWGDYDNDGDLDILLSGRILETEDPPTYSPISRVYRNHDESFIDIGAGLPGVYFSSVSWADYDNDGDLDIFLSGASGPSENICRVYRNDGGVFDAIGVDLEGVRASSAAWGDYDNDGDVDLLISGWTGSEVVSRVYRNNAGSFSIAASLIGVWYSSMAWGDYDNDGDLDILLTGATDTESVSRIYRNDDGIFTEINAGLPGVEYSAAAWGDYDNDGDLDILLTGRSDTGAVSLIFQNDSGVFTQTDEGLTGVDNSAVAWGDYDNDGDLDILLTGETESNYISRIYRNYSPVPNTSPNAPTNPTAQLVPGPSLVFSWDAATDAETPSPGLTYNLRVGTTPEGSDILSAMADVGTGYRKVVKLGNVNHEASWTIHLPDSLLSEYYWGVQTLDACFAGSLFAEGAPVVTAVSDQQLLPAEYSLHVASPTLLGSVTTIQFDMPAPGHVRLEVFDVHGRRVRTLISATVDTGRHTCAWDGHDEVGRSTAPGIYFLRMKSGAFRASQKLVLIK